MSSFFKAAERRKEERLTPVTAIFCGLWNQKTQNATTFLGMHEILNLSRLGLGLKLSDSGKEHALQNVMQDSIIFGSFEMDSQKIQFSAVVKTISSSFLGLEYYELSAEFMLKMKKILTPSYIAQSIYPLSKQSLNSSVIAAFRGHDFECVLFKSLDSKELRAQFFVDGLVFEICAENSEVLTRVNIKNAERIGNSFELMTSFYNLGEQIEKKQLKNALSSLNSICSFWKIEDEDNASLISNLVQSASAQLN